MKTGNSETHIYFLKALSQIIREAQTDTGS